MQWLSKIKRRESLPFKFNPIRTDTFSYSRRSSTQNIKSFAHLALPGQEGQVALDPRKLRGMPRFRGHLWLSTTSLR